MIIGYGRFGRTMELDPRKWGANGADQEPPLLLKDLALRNPEHTFRIVGRNPGEDPSSLWYPPNVVNPWQDRALSDAWREANREQDAVKLTESLTGLAYDMVTSCDAHVIWMGQHGAANSPVPSIEDRSKLTNPQQSQLRYAGWYARCLNAWREVDPLAREEVWLHPEPRNYNKARDLKWPPLKPLLGQYDYDRWQKHERFGDPRSPSDCGIMPYQAHWTDENPATGTWLAQHSYEYAAVELAGVRPPDALFSDDFDRPGDLGLICNETGAGVAVSRLSVLRDWILPLEPRFVHGVWRPESQRALGHEITPVPMAERFTKLHEVKCTFVTPASGLGWATIKAWEAMAAGCVVFFHPLYDEQGHILNPDWTKETDDRRKFLAYWLRVKSPEELAHRVKWFASNPSAWGDVVRVQREYYFDRYTEYQVHRTIERRLGLGQAH